MNRGGDLPAFGEFDAVGFGRGFNLPRQAAGDLNMVRAGVVDHPIKWVNSGYHEIQQPPKRYRVIDLPELFGLCSFSKLADFQQAHCQWVKIALRDELSVRDARWSETIAVGSLAFVEKVKGELGAKALHRELEQIDGTYALRESGEAYRGQIDRKNEALTPENTLQWERITEVAAT